MTKKNLKKLYYAGQFLSINTVVYRAKNIYSMFGYKIKTTKVLHSSFLVQIYKETRFIMSLKIVSKFISLLLLLTVFDNCLCSNSNTISSETPGFFLKVTKNVPRLGRRSHQLSDFENFFLKTSKSVPRIGRSDNVSNLQK